MLTIRKWSKFVEQDEYQNGCDPKSAREWEVDLTCKGRDENTLLQNIMDTLGVSRDAIEINPIGDDPSRIDVAITENDDASQPSEQEYEEWKRGERKLWYCIYTGYVQRVSTYAMHNA